MIKLKPEPKNAVSDKPKQVRPDAKIPAAPLAVSEPSPPVRQRAKQTSVRDGAENTGKPVPPVKPKRDRAEYMVAYRKRQIERREADAAELKRLRELVEKSK